MKKFSANTSVVWAKDRYYDVYCDIDGTIADCTHRRHWITGKKKDYKKFYSEMYADPVIEETAHIIRVLYDKGHRVVFGTGRPAEYRALIADWFFRNQIPYNALYTRATDDFRPDNIIKIELLEQMRKDGYNPKVAFDDRQRVVDALREAGLRVFQVDVGDF